MKQWKSLLINLFIVKLCYEVYFDQWNNSGKGLAQIHSV